MIKLFLTMMISSGITAWILYQYFYYKERKLLYRLYKMIEQAEAGSFQPEEISEEKISSLEHHMKKFLDGSLLEKREQKQQKEIIQGLISDISHQTLTPITNLRIYSELLCEEETKNKDIANTIREQTDKLDFLIRSLATLSRMENGIVEVHPNMSPIQSLFDAIRNEYKQKAHEKKIILQLKTNNLQACFDLKWTKEALGNIVDNAIKYTHSGGTVTVQAYAYTFFARIDVNDTGIGIAKEEYAKIFTRFYRSITVYEQPGVGIGLYLAREIIKAQHGYIKVHSEIGKGSVFSIFLPISNHYEH